MPRRGSPSRRLPRDLDAAARPGLERTVASATVEQRRQHRGDVLLQQRPRAAVQHRLGRGIDVQDSTLPVGRDDAVVDGVERRVRGDALHLQLGAGAHERVERLADLDRRVAQRLFPVGRTGVEAPVVVADAVETAEPAIERDADQQQPHQQHRRADGQRRRRHLPDVPGDDLGREAHAQHAVVAAADRDDLVDVGEALPHQRAQPFRRIVGERRRALGADDASLAIDEADAGEGRALDRLRAAFA